MPGKKKVCVVVGVGPGNGAALAHRFAKDGYAVALLARSSATSSKLASELPDARAFACDVSDAGSVARAFASIRDEMGEVDVVAYNAGSGVFGTLDDVTGADFEASWRVNSLGLLLVAKEVAPAMKAAKSGAIIVTGATASRRGVARTTAFAPAKAAQRSLCESLARQLGPHGIHVGLIIVDGVVDMPRTREWMKDKPDEFFIQPSGVAELASFLVRQDRSAWTFEAEARPFGESW
ncbi:SDR family NAD(P)-dependent oxidoreductase [Vulgatibacter incomptus]|uniref:Short-chain dehydrogenase, associated with 2-hydroxychromene-2-carboxylate isomerase family protein n=1 Tax=Vulgatibacter incomptus TaxID=1391653 RepID=A0A0K1PGM9_9BACT|nr:SDR family NAD(P)-dependent oxidoreductase [Vulgatibacter incomptus]AKU92662.1 Short-chain dehydrogenase, associated with 2-hydroxychromene-2-carboxylate isomerase family protein [Vulgatibacter incomptus]